MTRLGPRADSNCKPIESPAQPDGQDALDTNHLRAIPPGQRPGARPLLEQGLYSPKAGWPNALWRSAAH
jgi:hypothetical protein